MKAVNLVDRLAASLVESKAVHWVGQKAAPKAVTTAGCSVLQKVAHWVVQRVAWMAEHWVGTSDAQRVACWVEMTAAHSVACLAAW